MEQATLGPIASHRAMQATFAAPVEHTDDFSSMSFAELESLADDLSESSQWSLLDDVRAEIAERRDEGKAALERTFVAACDTHGHIPMVGARKVAPMFIVDYLREALDTKAGTTMAIDMVMHPQGRQRAILALAREYVAEQTEDLLRAGWTE